MAPVTALLAFVLMLLSCAPLRAEDAERRSPAGRQPHIRTTESRLRALVDEGQRRSATFRTLVARLEQSNVVVYLQYEHWIAQPLRIRGRLTFLSSAGGLRYVTVRMRYLPRADQLAILAHELQHAVEIAERPDIVDPTSMLRAYSRIGIVVGDTASGKAFETWTAVEAGSQVARELKTAARAERADATLARLLETATD